MDFPKHRRALGILDERTGEMLGGKLSPSEFLAADPPFSNEKELQELIDTENWVEFFCLFYPQHICVARVEGQLFGETPPTEIRAAFLQAFKWRQLAVQNLAKIASTLQRDAQHDGPHKTLLAHLSKFQTFAINTGMIQ